MVDNYRQIVFDSEVGSFNIRILHIKGTITAGQSDKLFIFLRISLKRADDKEIFDEDNNQFYLEEYFKFIIYRTNFDFIRSRIKL